MIMHLEYDLELETICSYTVIFFAHFENKNL